MPHMLCCCLCAMACQLPLLLLHAPRSTPNQVRWALYNVTMVLPDAEMSYVTYMFTLYSSPLQYLQEQTKFYSEVLNMTMLQVGGQWWTRWHACSVMPRPQAGLGRYYVNIISHCRGPCGSVQSRMPSNAEPRLSTGSPAGLLFVFACRLLSLH